MKEGPLHRWNLLWFQIVVAAVLKSIGDDGETQKQRKLKTSVLLSEGRWFSSPGLYVKVSLGKILNSKWSPPPVYACVKYCKWLWTKASAKCPWYDQGLGETLAQHENPLFLYAKHHQAFNSFISKHYQMLVVLNSRGGQTKRTGRNTHTHTTHTPHTHHTHTHLRSCANYKNEGKL